MSRSRPPDAAARQRLRTALVADATAGLLVAHWALPECEFPPEVEVVLARTIQSALAAVDTALAALDGHPASAIPADGGCPDLPIA